MKQVSNGLFASVSVGLLLMSMAVSALAVERASERTLENAVRASSELNSSQAITFDVFLDKRRMGTHRYEFESTPEDLKVTSTASFLIRMAFVTVFKYEHQALETWRGNCLTAVSSTTTTTSATSKDQQQALELELPPEKCEGSYAYWDKNRLNRDALLNAQTGQIEPANWQENPTAALPRLGSRKKLVLSTQEASGVQSYSITTESATFDLWYDAADNLLVMQTTSDGRKITYARAGLRFN